MRITKRIKILSVVVALLLCSLAEASVYRLLRRERLNFNSRGEVEVCWLGASDQTADFRKTMQDYLRSELTDRVGIPLVFIDDCLKHSDPFFPVGIAIFDDPGLPLSIRNVIKGSALDPSVAGHPMTYSWGSWANNELGDLVLTSRFMSVLDRLKIQAEALNDQGRENLLKSIVLHEMLHVLGFAHEQNHPDSTCHTQEQSYDNRLHEALTEYDAHSILNYCLTHHYDFNQGALPLSDLDIVGLRKIYGDLISIR